MSSRPSKEFNLKGTMYEKVRQEGLATQYGVKKKDVYIVERKSRVVQMFKIILRYFFSLLRILLISALIILALFGLYSLIYPNIRTELFLTLKQVLQELKQFIGIQV